MYEFEISPLEEHNINSTNEVIFKDFIKPLMKIFLYYIYLNNISIDNLTVSNILTTIFPP